MSSDVVQEIVKLDLPITMHHQRMWELRTNILIVFSLTMNVCFVLGLGIKLIVDIMMEKRAKEKGSASTACQYLAKKSGD